MNFAPYPYQKYCVERHLSEEVLGLFLDMGLGKTSVILTSLNDLRYNRFAYNKALVIAPKKVAESTWQKEAAKWEHLKNFRINTVLGTAKQRERALHSPGDLWVINRENIVWLVDYYRNDWPFDMVIVDESTSFKSHQAKRFKALCSIRSKIKRMSILTGTPAPGGLIDLWAQVFLLDQGQRLGRNITQYRERFFYPAQKGSGHQVFSYALKPGAEEEIYRLIGDICVSMKAEDYLQLPEVTENYITVTLDEKSRKEYKKLEREKLLEYADTVINAGTAAVLSNKLLQLCNGAVYDENKKVKEIHDAKIERFIELVEGLNKQPALVFYNFQHDATRIEKALERKGLVVRRLKTTKDQDDWNARKIDILLAHPASTAYGLNLQDGGNHIVWFGLNWSLELYQQANKRLHRQGQTQKVFIHHLVTEGGRDEDVITALTDKSATQEALIESLKARIAEAKGE